MKETELASKIITFLTAPLNEIYKEVSCFGRCTDIVIRRKDVLISIETKTSFNLSVIAQAYENRKNYHYNYVGVPVTKTSFAYTVCKELGIGIITVDWKKPHKPVVELLKPKYFEPVKKPKIHEFFKLNNAGVQSDRLTSFSFFVQNAEEQLLINGPMDAKNLHKLCHRHYHTFQTMKTNMIMHIKEGVIKNITYKERRFHLKQKE